MGNELRFDAYTVASEEHPFRNEDAYFVLPQGIAGVFDGIGGHPGSEAASIFAASYCREELRRIPDFNRPAEGEEYLRDLLHRADKALVREYSVSARGIGTTAIIAMLVTNPHDSMPHVCIAHAGDSRAYIHRDGRIVTSTLDHAVRMSRLKLEERRDIQQEIAHAYYRHEVDPFYWNYLYQRNIIASHLSSDYSHKRLTVDTLDVPLQRGDTILLTSDGIHDNLTDDEIAEIVANRRDTAQMLVRAAQARSHESHNQVIDTEDGPYEADYFRPKPDDMTAITMHISGVSS